jgi:agmatine deiminase
MSHDPSPQSPLSEAALGAAAAIGGIASGTPRADGFRLPARFAPHQRTLLSWPCREDLFGPLMGAARREWADVARGIARYEPVTVVVDPAQETEARELLGMDGGAAGDGTDGAAAAGGPAVGLLPLPLDDSWIRDNGPVFVRDDAGNVAAVRFRFDGWNEQFTPFDRDAAVPRRIAEAWGVRLYEAPFVLEGGAFNTDGEGTLLTTEQCLLHNRNLGLSRAENEALLREWLGVEKVIWLPFGLVEDSGPFSTSGHVDDVAQFVAPGVVIAQTCEPDNPNYSRLQENLELLEAAVDAAGRRLEVVESPLLPYVSGVGAGLDGVTGPGAGKLMPAPYVNMVFVEGAVLLPRTGVEGEDELHLEIGELVGREPVGLPTELSAFGGGGLGCITQQVPAGAFATPR